MKEPQTSFQMHHLQHSHTSISYKQQISPVLTFSLHSALLNLLIKYSLKI